VGLKFDPVGGGQFKQVVQQIIEADREPIRTLETRKKTEEARLKLFQEFKSKISGLQNSLSEIASIKKFKEYKVELGDGKDLIDITVDKEKVHPGTYQMEIKQLAERSGMISSGLTDPEKTSLGIGYIVLPNKKGDDFEIFVDPKNSNLRSVANLINNSKDSPVRASVVKDAYDHEKPWKLLLTAKNDGEENQIDFPEFYFLDSDEDFWIDRDRNSKNAYIKLDGFDIDLNSNDVVDFLDGVNVHLRQARPDKPFTLTITEDNEKIGGKMKEVVTKFNDVLEFINKQNSIDKNTDTKSTFAGDSGLQSIEYRLRNLLHEAYPHYRTEKDDEPQLVWLHQLGVSISKTGSVTFDENKFKKVIEEDFDRVAETLTGEFGFSTQLGSVLSSYSSPLTGLMTIRDQAIRKKIDQIDQTISNKEILLERKAENLVRKFSKLQGALASMQQQQAYLTSSMGGASGGNLVSQLLG